MPGDVVRPDRFSLMEPARQLACVARLIRNFHDAVQDFTAPSDARWQTLIPAEGSDIIQTTPLEQFHLLRRQHEGAT